MEQDILNPPKLSKKIQCDVSVFLVWSFFLHFKAAAAWPSDTPRERVLLRPFPGHANLSEKESQVIAKRKWELQASFSIAGFPLQHFSLLLGGMTQNSCILTKKGGWEVLDTDA